MALLNVSAMSFGALSGNALTALNQAAAKGGFAHDTGEGGLSPYHLKGGDVVWELGTGYFGARSKDGGFDADEFREKASPDAVKMVSLKLSQGAIRREQRLEWIGVRHEEAGAFAAGAQAQLTGTLGVCMGTVGPGSLHLLNGLYDAKKSHAPVLAICGQVPLAELGSDFFQEVDNDAVFSDVAAFCRTGTSPEQLPGLLEQAVQSALGAPGVAVLTLPGDVAGLDAPDKAPHFVTERRPVVPDTAALQPAAALLD